MGGPNSSRKETKRITKTTKRIRKNFHLHGPTALYTINSLQRHDKLWSMEIFKMHNERFVEKNILNQNDLGGSDRNWHSLRYTNARDIITMNHQYWAHYPVPTSLCLMALQDREYKPSDNAAVAMFHETQWASYQIRKTVGYACAGYAGNVFRTTDLSGNRLLAIPACITARAWRTCHDACRLTRDGGNNDPGIPGTCATRNFMDLVRGPWHPITSAFK